MRLHRLVIAGWSVGMLSACPLPDDHYHGPDHGPDAATEPPVPVADADDELDQPTALAVNETAIFWTEQTRVRSCPLPAGCEAEPALIAEGYHRLSAIAVTEDAVYFTGCEGCRDNHELRRCPVSGCPAPAPAVKITSGRFEDILVGRTHVYWRDSTEGMVGCKRADCEGTVTYWPSADFGDELSAATTDGDTVYVKTAADANLRRCVETTGCGEVRVVVNSASIALPFRVHDKMGYWLAAGPAGAVVRACWLGNCGSGSTFAEDEHGSVELEVDDSGVYWMNPVTGTIRHCPLTGCPQGVGVVLASGLTNPKELTLGAGSVYWIEDNTILQVAKP